MRRQAARIACAVGLAALAASAPGAAGQTATGDLAAAADLSRAFEAAARLVGPSVVEIFTTTYAPGQGVVRSTADLVTTQRASGSGVIVDPDGYIVTNAHVVRGAQRVRVAVPLPAVGQSILSARSRTMSGRIVGIDLETDLAVIKVEASGLPVLPFGDSDELKTGQVVLAFGSPLGLQNSVSMGVVSAVARQLSPESPMIYVQTDASINPGSSGGPLVDVQGRLVGINTLIFSPDGSDDGLGFAAPSNIVRTVYEQIRKHGRVRRGDIGVRAQTVTPELASGLGLTRDSGVILADVLPGSPAAHAGLRAGDFVLSLDGKPMENGRQLQVNLYGRFVGDVVRLRVMRDGEILEFPVAVAERPDSLAGLSESADPRENLVAPLGILGLDLTPQLAQVVPIVHVRAGVVVVSTAASAIDSPEGGLAVGDVIYGVNRQPVGNLAELRSALASVGTGDAVVLHLERGGELTYLSFVVD